MKHLFICFVIACVLTISVNSCYAADKSDSQVSTVDEMKKAITRSCYRGLRVKVSFKSGLSLSGHVEEVSETGFKLKQQNASSAATFSYAYVAAVKHESHFFKRTRHIAKYVVIAAAMPVLLPVVLVYGIVHPGC